MFPTYQTFHSPHEIDCSHCPRLATIAHPGIDGQLMHQICSLCFEVQIPITSQYSPCARCSLCSRWFPVHPEHPLAKRGLHYLSIFTKYVLYHNSKLTAAQSLLLIDLASDFTPPIAFSPLAIRLSCLSSESNWEDYIEPLGLDLCFGPGATSWFCKLTADQVASLPIRALRGPGDIQRCRLFLEQPPEIRRDLQRMGAGIFSEDDMPWVAEFIRASPAERAWAIASGIHFPMALDDYVKSAPDSMLRHIISHLPLFGQTVCVADQQMTLLALISCFISPLDLRSKELILSLPLEGHLFLTELADRYLNLQDREWVQNRPAIVIDYISPLV